MLQLAGLVLIASAALEVAAHGYLPRVRVGSTCWNVPTDPYANPPPLRSVRRTPNDSGFIANPTSADITCSIGNNYLPAGDNIPVAAGDTIYMHWSSWPVGHYGPMINYIAKCQGSCSTFKGDSGKVWTKISHNAFENGEWASDKFAKNNATWPVVIPAKLAPGNYLLRHETIALHGAPNIGGAQFYPTCTQITVTGSGTVTPPGQLAFPGAYSPTEPGIHFNPYQGEAANYAYQIPGGPVYQF